jgi:hypothetical protein
MLGEVVRTSMAAIALVLSLFLAGCGTAGLELVGCQPDGAINSLRASWDPKQFWIEQAAVFKEKIERWDLAGKLQKCGSESSEAKRMNCARHITDQYTAVERCEAHAHTFCQMHGGC